MIFLSTAAAETAGTAAETLQLTQEQTTALAGGVLIGVAMTTVLIIALVWYVFQVIADWKIFTKAGKAGWKSLIPIYNYYVEYDICWSGILGLVYVALLAGLNGVSLAQNASVILKILYAVVCVGAVFLYCMESVKLAKAFGKGKGFAVCMIFFGPIARLILGFGSAQYVGKPE